MSGSSVTPAGSNRMLVNFSTQVRSGTPYCRLIEIAIEKASITPASVEPCLPSLRKTSPSPSPRYFDAVMYPSAPPTENDVTVALRCLGRRRRTGRSEAHTSELQLHVKLVCHLLLDKKNY